MIVAMMLPSSIPLVVTFGALVGRRAPAGTAGRCCCSPATCSCGARSGSGRGWPIAASMPPSTPCRGSPTHPQLIIATTLAVAGLWQFSPLRDRCLEECRSPLGFVINRWRGTSERREAVRMGIAHGAFCVGCCWSLMLVMFGVGLASLTRDARARRADRDREEPAVGSAPDPTARRRADPGGGLRGRRVTSASYPRRVVDGAGPTDADAWRTPRSGDRGHACARSSPRRATACSRTATPTSRPAAWPKPPGSRSARSTTTSDRSCQLILAVLAAENERLLERQRAMFDAPEPLWVRWELRLRLPRHRRRLGLRPDPPGDDRRGLDRRRGGGVGPGDDRRLVPAAGRGRATRGGGRCRPGRVHAGRGRGPDGDTVPRARRS